METHANGNRTVALCRNGDLTLDPRECFDPNDLADRLRDEEQEGEFQPVRSKADALRRGYEVVDFSDGSWGWRHK